jgi:hypothetical protein
MKKKLPQKKSAELPPRIHSGHSNRHISSRGGSGTNKKCKQSSHHAEGRVDPKVRERQNGF